MRINVCLAVLCTMFCAGQVTAQEEPEEVLFTQQALHKTPAGKLVLEGRRVVVVPEVRTIQRPVKTVREIGGRQVTETVTFEEEISTKRFELVLSLQTVELGKVEAFNSDGNKVALEDIAARLTPAKPIGVLVSATGEMPPAYLLSIYKKGTLVIVPPRSSHDEEPADHAATDDTHGGIANLVTPEAFPPRQTFVTQEASGEWKLREVFEFKDTTTAYVDETIGGVARKTPISVRVSSFASETRTYPPKTVQVTNLQGALLGVPAAMQQFAKERLVLESADGKAIHSFFTDLVKPETLVVIAPALRGSPGWNDERLTPENDAAPAAPPAPAPPAPPSP